MFFIAQKPLRGLLFHRTMIQCHLVTVLDKYHPLPISINSRFRGAGFLCWPIIAHPAPALTRSSSNGSCASLISGPFAFFFLQSIWLTFTQTQILISYVIHSEKPSLASQRVCSVPAVCVPITPCISSVLPISHYIGIACLTVLSRGWLTMACGPNSAPVCFRKLGFVGIQPYYVYVSFCIVMAELSS